MRPSASDAARAAALTATSESSIRRRGFGGPRPLGREVVDDDPELARGGAQREQPLLGPVEPAGLHVEGVGGGVDRGQGLQRFGDGAIHRLGGGDDALDRDVVLAGAGLDRLLPRALQRAEALGQAVRERIPAHGVARRLDIGQRLLGGAQQRPLLGQGQFLAALGRQGGRARPDARSGPRPGPRRGRRDS